MHLLFALWKEVEDIGEAYHFVIVWLQMTILCTVI
jgi:hypothetical protein